MILFHAEIKGEKYVVKSDDVKLIIQNVLEHV